MLEFYCSSSYQELGFDGVVDLGVSTFSFLVDKRPYHFLLGPTCLVNITVPGQGILDHKTFCLNDFLTEFDKPCRARSQLSGKRKESGNGCSGHAKLKVGNTAQ
jgi:hypothetical protein